MTIAFVRSNSSTGSNTVALTGIGAGDLIVLLCKWESATTGTLSVTDGTTALSLGTRRNYGTSGSIQIAYLLSANAGNKTFTVTWPSGAAYKALMIMEFSHTQAVTFDAENGASGDSTSPNSGNITTGLNSSVMFGGSISYPIVPTDFKIGTDAADAVVFADTDYASLWYKIYTVVQTNKAANCALSESNAWVCSVTSIKEADAAGGSILRQMMEHHGG